ncbi:MAG TPA: helix-turn-helix domain-containing protein [Jatrophihabitantaceae bacterium]
MTDERPPIELTDPRALRAYAHPVRGKLLGLLRRRGPLTATGAAELLGESSGTTSFHLRQLAKYGLVEEAPGGTGRQKPWQATSLLTHIPPIQATPEAAEAAKQLRISMAQRYFEWLVRWLQQTDDETDEWRSAALFGDRIIWATAAELEDVKQAVEDLIEPYARRLTEIAERPEGAREISYIAFAFPMEPP